VISLKHRLLALIVAIALCFSPFAAVRPADAQEGGVVVTDLGTPITGVVTVMTAAFGVENGRNVMYTVVQADPAIFVTVDMDEDKVIRTLELPDAGGSWSQAVDTFGNVYIGTYAKGLLYRFEPATETLVNLGRIAGEDYVYGLFPGPNGKMYGGTYPNGKTFEYDPATNTVTDFGTMKEGELYVRGTVYDANRNVLYAGTGSHGDLIEYDLATGTKRSVLAEEYREGEPFLYDMNIAGTTLFVRKEKAKTMLAIDTRTNTVLAEVPMISRSPSPKSPVADKVYYTNNLELTEYDLNTNTARGLGLRTQGTGVAYGFAQLKDPEMPGYTLVGLAGNGGGFFKYNLETGRLINLRLALPGAPKPLNAVVNGPDGSIHVGGFLTGAGLASYNPATGTIVQTSGISQVEGFGTLGDYVYAGVYPEAQLFRFDPATQQIVKLLNLAEEGQDRPYAVLGLEQEQLIAIGTVATYGAVEGALTLYDPVTGQADVYKNIVGAVAGVQGRQAVRRHDDFRRAGQRRSGSGQRRKAVRLRRRLAAEDVRDCAGARRDSRIRLAVRTGRQFVGIRQRDVVRVRSGNANGHLPGCEIPVQRRTRMAQHAFDNRHGRANLRLVRQRAFVLPHRSGDEATDRAERRRAHRIGPGRLRPFLLPERDASDPIFRSRPDGRLYRADRADRREDGAGEGRNREARTRSAAGERTADAQRLRADA
jgi:hypothetical protein